MKDQVVLLTGGTGSFGHEFTRQALEMGVKALRIFSRNEHRQEEMEREFHDDRLRFMTGCVRDLVRLELAMMGADLVVHAAAMKVVPKCEYDPLEAVKTNILGAANVIQAAIRQRVSKVMAISTDKACYPINHYGKTKAVAESLFTAAGVYTGHTRFACVRYGNVIGSQGSVIPLWRKLAEEGRPIILTDHRMTRFLLTISSGVRFVINCMRDMKGGEIFVPRVPSVYMYDLAKVVAPGAQVVSCGIRPGEKLHEVLITREEMWRTVKGDLGFVIQPHLHGTALHGEPQEYSSINNPQLTGRDKLAEYLEEL